MIFVRSNINNPTKSIFWDPFILDYVIFGKVYTKYFIQKVNLLRTMIALSIVTRNGFCFFQTQEYERELSEKFQEENYTKMLVRNPSNVVVGTVNFTSFI